MANDVPAEPNRKRSDGRKPLLVYMDEALIKELKKAAVDEDCNTYEIVEELVRHWLDERKRKVVGKSSKR